MRDIRFREWDQERENMMPGHGMSYSEREEFDDSTSFRFEHEEDLDYTERQKETDRNGTPYRALEQYTGSKDADGQEIYEGDILQDLTDGYVVGTVEYNDGAFECAGYNMYDASDYKVIGNIHEDGDLIDH